MRTSPEINELATALAAAQGEIEVADKDAKNPHFGSVYASLAEIRSVCRGPLAKNKIAVLQSPELLETKMVSLTTRLMHASGQWAENTIAAMPRDQTPQSVGSVITYLRRYGLASMVGIVSDEDDDGNAAQGLSPRAKTPTNLPPPAPAPGAKPPAAGGKPPAAWHPSEKQLARLFAISKASGYTTDQTKFVLKSRYKIESTKDLKREQYEELCVYLEKHPMVASTDGDPGYDEEEASRADEPGEFENA